MLTGRMAWGGPGERGLRGSQAAPTRRLDQEDSVEHSRVSVRHRAAEQGSGEQKFMTTHSCHVSFLFPQHA